MSQVSFELIPPLGYSPDKSATTTFFKAWRSLKGFSDCQIEASQYGIRFLISTQAQNAASLRRLLVAYFPGLKIRQVQVKPQQGEVVYWRPRFGVSSGDWLATNPLNYLTTALSPLQKQTITYKLKLKPTRVSLWSLLAKGLVKTINFLLDARFDQPPARIEKTKLSSEFKLKTSLCFTHGNAEQAPDLFGALNLLSTNSAGWRFKPWAFRRCWRASSQQLADLFHLPLQNGNTDNLEQTLFKTLPIPPSLKQKTPGALHLGQSNHRWQTDPVYLPQVARARHLYVMGGTGVGKTTFLKNQIVQDIIANRGVVVVDPHGDLATSLLDQIPKSRQKDLIYFDPSDLTQVIGINLLEVDQSLKDDQRAIASDLVTEATVSVLRRLFSAEGEGGHRIEYILRNAIQTALTIPGATIFTIYRLLNDRVFRFKSLANLTNKDLILFWREEMGKAGDYQRVKLSIGITSKIGRFLFCLPAKRVFGQAKGLDFNQVIGQKKILICNLAKGALGDDTTRLFGATILAKVGLASLAQAKLDPDKRQACHLYVDEFQDFATTSFVEMLSEARKYRLFLTLAQQSAQQQAIPRLNEIILANVGTIVAFRSGSPQDAKLMSSIFEPYLQTTDFINLPVYNFYVRLGSSIPCPPVSALTYLK